MMQRIAGLALCAALTCHGIAHAARNCAQFVSQDVPLYMLNGKNYTISITMKNCGEQAWTRSAGYKLGAQAPQDNALFGVNRVDLGDGESIGPGQQKIFTFTVTAPTDREPKVYNFQWRMVEELKEWFGDLTPNTPQAVLVNARGEFIGGGYASAPQPRNVPEGKQLIMHTFYWYDGSDRDFKERPMDFGTDFSFRSVAWWERLLKQTKGAGSDILTLVSWPDVTFPDAKSGFSFAGLPHLVRAWRNLQARGILNPRVAIFYDTSVINKRFNHWNTTLDLRYPWQRAPVIEGIMAFYSYIPRDMWARINGRPVVLIWVLGAYGEVHVDQNFMDDLRKEFAKNFGGEIPHILLENTWRKANLSAPGAAYSYWPWGASVTGLGRSEDMFCAGPGYDERGLGRQESVVSRDEDGIKGFRYAKAWQEIIRKNGRTACVETWNEYFEGSQVGPTREEGYFYSALTKNHANLWKGLVNSAQHVNYRAPDVMSPGESAEVAVTVANTGTTEWSPNIYKLGSQHPQDDGRIWGISRVNLGDEDFVQPGQRHTFRFRIKAPEQEGTYPMRWCVLAEWGGWLKGEGQCMPEHRIEVRRNANTASTGSGSGAPSGPGQPGSGSDSGTASATGSGSNPPQPTGGDTGSTTAQSAGGQPATQPTVPASGGGSSAGNSIQGSDINATQPQPTEIRGREVAASSARPSNLEATRITSGSVRPSTFSPGFSGLSPTGLPRSAATPQPIERKSLQKPIRQRSLRAVK